MNTDIGIDMKLNDMQQHAFVLATEERQNIFLTGSGGVGKSVVIKKIYDTLAPRKHIGLTSLTGISASIIGGHTLHSYLGIGLGAASFEKLYKKIKESKFINYRWRQLDILIIDEISMMPIDLFEKIEKLARKVRKVPDPFGGIQLILSGDFLQIKPVGSDKYCFESLVWKQVVNTTVHLTEIIRQKDIAFSSILNKIRFGNIDNECRELLKTREIKYISNTGLIPTMLYSTNDKVDRTNAKYYNKLQGHEYTYMISFEWFVQVKDKEKYEKMAKFPFEINLRVGAQVMYLINCNDLVNGSRGVIKSFVNGFPSVLFVDGIERVISPSCFNIEDRDEVIVSYAQLPLKLAWAMTIHKSQGSTLDLVRIDFGNIFEYGQFYVAISRCKTLDGLFLRNLDFNTIMAHPKAVEFYNKYT